MRARTGENYSNLSTTVPSTPLQGVGIGLRPSHASEILSTFPAVDWLELLVDNHLCNSGFNRAILMPLAEHYPLSLHCVNMDLGGSQPLNRDYFKRLRNLTNELQPRLISDHISFCRSQDSYLHNLLPLPFTEEALEHISERIRQAQDLLNRPLLVENVSRYIDYQHSTLREGVFMTELANRTGCQLLIDVNNAFVNQHNHQHNAYQLLDDLALTAIGEIHLAGFEKRQHFLLDSHASPVAEPVWQLYQELCQRLFAAGLDAPALIEWDNQLPPLRTLLDERQYACNIREQLLASKLPSTHTRNISSAANESK
ncbi:hypothetical protein EDC56_0853 [Sinobacterium caligoides]|uniref:Uncharacterized protein n=1 Tax=Sinobacterium caligoides TaxID=933926 RepID=A0A3N2DZM7_9GAMM|nr:DUF692 domain-containing protein [Sinobacterium caligoides]ROS05323.1 hypothetical protein EDC56_0853 [Sinobacterium caligoides]